jgi:FAD/FMN-containing dehydrogenase
MTIANMRIAPGVAAAEDLRAVMRGKVLLQGDEDYPRVRQLWNGAIEHRPAVVAICQTAGDVQAAIRAARVHGLPLSVRGGGHDWAGRALRHRGLVIDLTEMRNVEVNSIAMVAAVGGGTTGTDLALATTPHGLAAVTANVGSVGLAGFLLGGGYGPLTTRFGLGLDNLLGAEIVLADGRIVWADDAQNQDLFWAIRGGGGNFGVVTQMRIRLHTLRGVLAGVILFPWHEAQAVLRRYADLMASAPDELAVLAGVFSGPDGSPMLLLGPVWSGDLHRGEQFMDRLKRLGTPAVSQIAPMGYSDLLDMYTAKAAAGLHYALQTRWLADLSPELISAVIQAGEERTSRLSFVAIHHFHGPGTEVAPDATAFHLRRSHFLMEIGAAWEPDSLPGATLHKRWLSEASSRITPHALPGGYPNFLTHREPEQIAWAYGENAQRLCRLKRKFDPENVFSSTTPLPL